MHISIWHYVDFPKVIIIYHLFDKKVFNGDIGRITSIFTIGEDEDDCGKRCFKVDFDGNEVVFDMKAASDFILAYATTIHKSQGLTFERAIIDARNSFAHGQTYVALSLSLIHI